MNNMTVEIICDGNSQIGFGHIRRSVSLAHILRERFSRVAVRGLSFESQQFIPQEFQISLSASIVLVDCPYDVSDVIQEYKSQGKKVAGLDGNHREKMDLNIFVFDHAGVSGNENTKVGFDYVIVRPDIQLMKSKVKKCGYVLVCIGGGDFLGQSISVAKLLSEAGFSVELVMGPLADLDIESISGTVIHRNPSNFVELMSNCEWAVSNGAGTLFELLYLGKPVWALPQTAEEERIVGSLSIEGALLGAGLEKLKEIRSDLSARMKNSNLRNIIDGRGAVRICALLEELINEKR